ncbi:uncharacterized protein LOC125713026 [Brienomyrus brachyistius]|uniref:uncharacterized protein LOC125713026 n=1 Tax=Brienomyrus brachyistius TaxID=42636 RepID=UPI0020B1E075|nr:uncharacterized protein LOC125713026 [Brienomyrus brachyistius]
MFAELLQKDHARREDFTAATSSSRFLLPFCGQRWLEHLPAVKRALEVWPSVVKYVDLVKSEKTGVPMMPFLWKDLAELIQTLLQRFIKRDPLPLTPYKLVRLDVSDQKLWLSPKEVDIGMAVIKVMQYPSSLIITCTMRQKAWILYPSFLQHHPKLMSFSIKKLVGLILTSGCSARTCCYCPMGKPKWNE